MCLTVIGADAGGTSTETTCSDLVTVTGEVSYSWRVVSSDGPPIFLSSRAAAHPTFVAPDDGRYVLELTVGDGTGSTAADRVTVDVENANPVLAVTPGDAYVGGVTQITGTFTDPGWQDTHRAVVAWGDGTTSEVAVSTFGAGWGTFFDSHVYRTAGSFDVTVTLHDDDGGTDVATLPQFEVGTAVAVWANSTSAKSFDWTGGSGQITGRVHTNGGLRFVGAAKSVSGPTTYAGPLSADTAKNSFLPLPVKSTVQDYPFQPELADLRPGGRVADELGARYHDMSSRCSGGSWHDVQQTLAPGVYYATCDIQLNGSQIGGRVTLVTEGHVKISGSKPAFEPYYDGLLAVAGASGNMAIDISASRSKFLGVLFAGSGQISISGASNRFFCGILGDQVDISGNDVSVRGASCGRPDQTVSGPVLVPDLQAEVAVDRATALPSDNLGYDVRVTNRGATLVVPSLIGLENVDATTATVNGYTFTVERRDATTGAWVPVGTSGDPALRVDLRSNAFPGVVYPAGGGVAGTVVPPSGWATWGLQAVLDLTPSAVDTLLDPARTSALRTTVDFDLGPAGVQARRLYTLGNDFVGALRDLSASATEARVTTILPDGDATELTSADEPALAEIASGDSVTLHRSWRVPVPADRTAGETDAGYLARLSALDGTELNAAAFATSAGGVGRLVAPLAQTSTTRQLPVVGVSTTGAATMAAGTTEDYRVRLAGIGSADVASLTTRATADGSPLTLTGAPDALAAGELVEATTSYAAPDGSSGPIAIRGEATWQDARGNTYGPSGSTRDVVRLAPAQLRAQLTDALLTDVGGDGVASPGDVLRYTLTVRNGGGIPLTGVTGTVDTDGNSALVSGSGRTPDGGTITFDGRVVTVALPDIDANAARSVTFDVTVTDPFPSGATRLSAQGTLGATGHDARPTDDPALPGPADPTRTTVTVPVPALAATLGGRLVIDADGSGTVTPGDTLAYTLGTSSVGTLPVTGVRATVDPPAGTRLVDGSVHTSQGTITAGPRVDVGVGTLAPYQEATIDFRLRLDATLPAGVTAIVTRGLVSSDQLDPVPTDDPQTVEAGDASTLPIGDPATDPEKPRPGIAPPSPGEGTVVTEPVQIRAGLTAPAGEDVASWRIVAGPVGSTDRQTLAVSDGSSLAVATATFDPTVLPNGMYEVTVLATATGGGQASSSVVLVVDGNLKLGRFTTSIQDHQIGLGGLPLQVVRSYDSFDKATGDFGVGWNVDVADFSVRSNGPLGEGGWTMKSTSCGLIFCNLGFTSSRPHVVSVVWPDGRQELFDLTPSEGSTFFKGLTQAKFTGRPGTTSTLAVEDNSLFWVNGNLNGGAFGSGGVFDPQRFRLTDRNGTVYELDTTSGLTRATDRLGNHLTIDEGGITSSLGPAIDFTRDPQGRISRIDSPAGASTYTYDAAGDLVAVTGVDGARVGYRYDGRHNLLAAEGAAGRSLGSVEYGADGRIDAIVDATGNRIRVEADVADRQEVVHDAAGRLTTVSTFDARGNQVREEQIGDGRSIVTRWTYDAQGHPLTETAPGGGETALTWTDRGDVGSITRPSGERTDYVYDGEGRLLRQRDGTGATLVELAYDSLGSVKRQTLTDGRVMDFTYDAKGQLLELRRDGALVQSFRYSAEGKVTEVQDVGLPLKTYSYDAAGRITSVGDGTTPATTFGYDQAGRVVRATDAASKLRRWSYDELGNMLTATDPSGAVTRYTYDGSSRLTSRTDRNGDTVTYTHDPNGRVTRTEGPDETTTATYDAFGRVTRLADSDARLDFEFDDEGNVVRQSTAAPDDGTLPAVSLSYTYDVDGAPLSVTGPDGRRSFGYDRKGHLRSIVDNDGATFDLDYDALDRLTGIAYPNGVQDTLAWRPDGDMGSRVGSRGATTLVSQQYEYADSGRRTAVVDTVGRHEFGYDPAGRLATETHPAAGAVPSGTYSYDVMGNRTSGPGSPAGSTVLDSNDRLRRDGSFDYTYDAEGHLTRRVELSTGAVRSYAWSDGELREVVDDGVRTRYRYDPLGRRVEVDGPDGVRRFVYDGQNVAYVFDGSNEMREAYTTTGVSGMVVSRTKAGAKSYPLADALGSVVAWTDTAGEVLSRTGYSAFGTPDSSGSAVYGFTGHQYDGGTGLVYARARYYDPAIGRFLSEDPVPSLNPYTYLGSDPCNAVDPTGASAAGEYSYLARMGAQVARFLAEEAGSYACAGVMNAVLGLGMSPNMKGQLGEEHARRLLGNPQAYEAYEWNGRGRIADFRLPGQRGEVKNVFRQAFTQQLKDLISGSARDGLDPPVLITRYDTKLSAPLLKAAADKRLYILRCLPG